MEVSALKPAAMAGLQGPSPLLRLQSDERLIALIRRGQHAAFETLFSRYHSRLLAFCRHMLGSREDAEDVLQEVFAAAFNAILADEREINVRPWLYRIARNRSLNHLRRASAIGVDSMDVHFAEGGISTGEKVLRRESFRQLIADVQQLPETQRTALLLREIDALSYDQIAEAMETTIPSVKSLLVRARISLAEAAEARQLSCDQVREQLGEAAEGIAKVSPAARRHIRSCERCRSFRKQLQTNNVALAAVMPVGATLMLKKLLATKLSGAAGHVAGGAGAGAGAAASGTSAVGGLASAGVGTLAGKAVAGLAAAALLTAGAVAANHPVQRQRRASVASEQAPPSGTAAPVVVQAVPQRPSAELSAVADPKPAVAHGVKDAAKPAALAKTEASNGKDATATTSSAAAALTTTITTTSATATGATEEAKGAPAQAEPPATEVVTEKSSLPSTQASASAGSTSTITTTSTDTSTTTSASETTNAAPETTSEATPEAPPTEASPAEAPPAEAPAE